MALFQPRNRYEIFREMVARVVGRSKLARLERSGGVYHTLAAATNEDAEQYVQLTRLRRLQDLSKCKGSDLDERAAEILPARLPRVLAVPATTTLVFGRVGTAGTTPIPVGSQFFATDAQGQIRFRTTAAGSIPNGDSTSAAVPCVATVAGVRANVEADTIVGFATAIPGVTSVTNPAAVSSGVDRESDDQYYARIRDFIQAMSRATATALVSFAKQVILPDGRRVLYAKTREPAIPNGVGYLYIDDGTGAVETYNETFFTSPEVVVSSAAGGEMDLYTQEKPIRDDGSFLVERDSGSGYVALVRGTDYELNPGTGQIELSETAFPSGLTAGDAVRVRYRNYTGLIEAVTRVIEGEEDDRIRYPGVRGFAGVQVRVRAAVPAYQSLAATVSVKDGFDIARVTAQVKSAIQRHINTLDIGEEVLLSDLIAVAKAVPGVYDFTITSLSGSSPPANQIILGDQVARAISSAISVV